MMIVCRASKNKYRFHRSFLSSMLTLRTLPGPFLRPYQVLPAFFLKLSLFSVAAKVVVARVSLRANSSISSMASA